MDKPVFVAKQHPRKVMMVECLLAMGLCFLLYIIFLFVSILAFRKGYIETPISRGLHIIIIALLIFLSLTHAVLSHIAAKKREYYFYQNRLEFERKAVIDPEQPNEIIFYAGIGRIIVYQSLLDKLFHTGTMKFDEFTIKHIDHYHKIALFLNDQVPHKVVLS